MQDVCTMPWMNYGIGQNVCQFCCYKQINSFPTFTGIWDGKDLWNGEESISFRKDMLERGKLAVCGNSRCAFLENSIEDMLSIFTSTLKPSVELSIAIDMVKTSIKTGKAILDYTPLVISVSPSEKCNCSCPMCYIGTSKNKDLFVKDSQFRNIQSIVSNSFSYLLCGGEFFSFSDSEIQFLLKPINPYKTKTIVYTNGQLMTLEKYDKYVAFGPIDSIFISIDSVDPNMYKIIRGVDISPIKCNIADIVGKYKSNRITGIQAVISRLSYQGLLDLVKFAKSNRINVITFLPLDPYNVKNGPYKFFNIFKECYEEKIYQEFVKIVEQCEDFAKKNGITLFGLRQALVYMEKTKL